MPGGPVKPRREHAHPGFLSAYRRFWRGCRWEVFARPSPWGVAGAKDTMQASTAGLEARPGVYEFALTHKRVHGKRVKVYVGESGSVAKRHGSQYALNGDHLHDLMDQALTEGQVIWRRVRYVPSKAAAEQWEARWLAAFDYAWNAVQNGRKRALAVRREYGCLCIPTGVAVVELQRQFSPGKGGGKPLPASKQQHKQRIRQPQFLVG